jgi:hypothetical protein
VARLVGLEIDWRHEQRDLRRTGGKEHADDATEDETEDETEDAAPDGGDAARQR